MADGFTVIAQRRTVQPTASGNVQDVVEVTARTSPSGVTFTRIIPYDIWAKKGVEEALAPIATNIEAAMSAEHVVSATPYQTLNDQGQIVNGLEFTITTADEAGSANPQHTTTVDVPLQTLHDAKSVLPLFKDAEDALAHSASL